MPHDTFTLRILCSTSTGEERREAWRVHTFVYILGKTFVKTFMAHGRFSFSERTSQRAAGDGAVVVQLGSTHAPALPLRIPKKAEKHILRSAYTHTRTHAHTCRTAPLTTLNQPCLRVPLAKLVFWFMSTTFDP